MSVIAISETAGSLGVEIGQAAAAVIGYELADREIIEKAAERFGGPLPALRHVTEEGPTLLERFQDAERRYVAFIEATILELAARDNVILVGRGATVILAGAPHTLRLRVDAPEAIRAARLEPALGPGAALEHVRRTDRERAARVRFLYHVDWAEPRLYDLVLNTDRLEVDDGVGLVRGMLDSRRFRSTADSRQMLSDRSVVAQMRARLLASTATAAATVNMSCADGVLALEGRVDSAVVWEAIREAADKVPGLRGVRDEIALIGYDFGGLSDEDQMSHHGYLHGEARSWGGYGGGWYEHEWAALRKYRASRERPPAGTA